jgi:hypothetical protein
VSIFTVFYTVSYLERKRNQMKISEKGGREPFPEKIKIYEREWN